MLLNLKLETSHPPRPTVTEKLSPQLENDKHKPALPLPTGTVYVYIKAKICFKAKMLSLHVSAIHNEHQIDI